MQNGREDDAFEKKKITCLSCGDHSFKAKIIKIDVTGKEIEGTAWVCSNCNTPLMDSFKMNELLDKYRHK